MKSHSIKLIILLAAALIVSCVPGKKVAYLQYKNEYNEPETIVKDSLIRKYMTGELAYRLQPGDMLDVKISTMTPLIYNPFADADRTLIPGQQMVQTQEPSRQLQSTGYYVEPNGMLNLPVLGRIYVEGFTIGQAEDALEAHVVKYLEKPVVRLKLQNYRFTVIGEVTENATITSGDNSLTLLQALGMAGGASEFADLSRVKVLRHYDAETYVFYVNLLSEEFLSSPFYFVQPGDVIVVSPLKQRSYLKYMSPNLSVLTASISLLIGIVTLLRIW
jgi:polysaccharide export outer membrane protein